MCYPDSKVHGANMGPTWVLSAPDGPHIGPMNLAIKVIHRTPLLSNISFLSVHISSYDVLLLGDTKPLAEPTQMHFNRNAYINYMKYI